MRGHTVAIVIMAVSFFVLTVVAGYLFAQNQNIIQHVYQTSSDVLSTQTRTDNPEISEYQVVVVVEGEPELSTSDKDGLYKKVINPFIDYYKEEKGSGNLMSVKISANPNPSKSIYPYKGDAIFDSGINSGFLISKNAGVIDWWLPECMNACNFSNSFKAKYPEIVSKVN